MAAGPDNKAGSRPSSEAGEVAHPGGDPTRDPALLERYALGEAIASGAFGDIYRATQRSTGQEVAIKFLRAEPVAEVAAARVERFRRETQLCAALQHPNIVRLIDSGEAPGGGVYAVFELVRGSNLADLLAAEGALEPAEVLHLMGQVLDALACAHAEGVVHRDLKPANIMVAETGARRNALILDFGLGTFYGEDLEGLPRMTQVGEFLGTPAYSAPEQLRGEPASPATDLFAWGLVVLECLTGEHPLEGPMRQALHRQLGPEPLPVPAPLLDHPLGLLLARVIEKNVSLREGSAERVLAELLEIGPLPGRDELRRAPARSAPSVARTPPELSRRWLVPLRRNPNFTGRDAQLDQLAESLDQRGLLAVVALSGLGGVGKTQLALEYAYRRAAHYDLVAWLRAEEPETLAEDFAHLADELDLPERDAPDQRRKIEAVRAWLERSGRWLLVLDNAPNPDAIRSFLPRTATGHMLVTSRHPSWRELGRSLAIEELPLEEAVEFLLHRTGGSDRAEAAQLAEELGRLPLALEKAAAYIETTGRSIQTYLPLLRDQQKVLLAAPGLPDYPETLRGAWELSFRQVEEELPAAADLLRLCAFLAPDDVPFEMLTAGREVLPPALAEAARDPIAFDACVAALRRYSLVKVESDALSMHRMVQLVTRERLGGEQKAVWAERALHFAEATFPARRFLGDLHPASGRYLPHALAALSHARSLLSCAMSAGRLLQGTGNYLSARGFHAQACQHLERALRLFERASGPRDVHVADLLSDQGLILYALGELEPARTTLERAAEIHEELRGPHHLQVAIDLMELAWVIRTEGDLERVREISERAIGILRKSSGAGHPLEAMGLSTLCRALFGLGEIEQARECAERALKILEDGALYHPLMCSCWLNLGQIQLDLGDLSRADACIARALEISMTSNGRDHPITAANMAVRGAIEDRRGRLEEAQVWFERSLESAERTCRHLHEEIAIARGQLGDALRRLREPDAARVKLRHAQAQMDRVCGERSRLGAQIETATAALLLEEGQLEAARSHAVSALASLDNRYGPEHPYRIPTLNLLARVERARGERQQALGYAERALRLGDAAFGGRHPDLADSHLALALLAADRGDAEAERRHFERERELRPAPSPGN